MISFRNNPEIISNQVDINRHYIDSVSLICLVTTYRSEQNISPPPPPIKSLTTPLVEGVCAAAVLPGDAAAGALQRIPQLRPHHY